MRHSCNCQRPQVSTWLKLPEKHNLCSSTTKDCNLVETLHNLATSAPEPKLQPCCNSWSIYAKNQLIAHCELQSGWNSYYKRQKGTILKLIICNHIETM
jgi:hypothetical protein